MAPWQLMLTESGAGRILAAKNWRFPWCCPGPVQKSFSTIDRHSFCGMTQVHSGKRQRLMLSVRVAEPSGFADRRMWDSLPYGSGQVASTGSSGCLPPNSRTALFQQSSFGALRADA